MKKSVPFTLICGIYVVQEVRLGGYMDSTTRQLINAKVIPMIKECQYQDGVDLASSLILGGVEALNISQQSDDGLELLRFLSAQYPQVLCGGGNVQTVGEARNAIEAGAKFILSPLFDPSMIELCQNNGIAIYPVITDGVVAIEHQLKTVGMYPIEKLGGLEAVERLYTMFGIHSIVAGGITDSTLTSYITSKAVVAATGSWMIHPEHLKNRAFDKIAIAYQKTLLIANFK